MKTAEVEADIAAMLDVTPEQVVATTSGTMALYLALAAAGVGEGQEVIVPDVTFPATANAVVMTGAEPVLVDVKDDLTIDPARVSAALSDATAAIIAVHVSGRPADVKTLKAYGLPIIEDACEAFGSIGAQGYLGTCADSGAFSFTANKLVCSGQGGAVVFERTGDAATIRRFKNQGRLPDSPMHEPHPSWGVNGKWTDLQASVAQAQLSSVRLRLEHRRQLRGWYAAALADVAEVTLFPAPPTARCLWVDVLLDRPAAGVYAAMLRKGIECRPFWATLHRNPTYFYDEKNFPVATSLAPRALWLPSHLEMTEDHVQDVVTALKEVFSK